MADRSSHDDNKALADRLEQEGRETRPVFSKALHARVCRAIEHCEMEELPRPAGASFRGRWVYSAVAAALVVVALLLAWRNVVPKGPAPGPVDVAVSIPPEPLPVDEMRSPAGATVDAAVEMGLLVDSTMTSQRWAYLDHDARLAAQMLIDQLPLDMTLPTDEP